MGSHMEREAKYARGRQPVGTHDYNLLGQRLGRKGQETRERILVAALTLIEMQDAPVTLSAVAREVSVRMTNLYRYFPDLGELVLACLNRVMATADAQFMDKLRERWPDETLQESILDFLKAHYQFWLNHTRILHMRNSFADAGDIRYMTYRQEISRPLMELLAQQMDVSPAGFDTAEADMATVIVTAFERIATVLTNASFPILSWPQGITDQDGYVNRLMEAEAQMIALVVRHRRALASVEKAPRHW